MSASSVPFTPVEASEWGIQVDTSGGALILVPLLIGGAILGLLVMMLVRRRSQPSVADNRNFAPGFVRCLKPARESAKREFVRVKLRNGRTVEGWRFDVPGADPSEAVNLAVTSVWGPDGSKVTSQPTDSFLFQSQIIQIDIHEGRTTNSSAELLDIPRRYLSIADREAVFEPMGPGARADNSGLVVGRCSDELDDARKLRLCPTACAFGGGGTDVQGDASYALLLTDLRGAYSRGRFPRRWSDPRLSRDGPCPSIPHGHPRGLHPDSGLHLSHGGSRARLRMQESSRSKATRLPCAGACRQPLVWTRRRRNLSGPRTSARDGRWLASRGPMWQEWLNIGTRPPARIGTIRGKVWKGE
jgi:hypothetical protein